MIEYRVFLSKSAQKELEFLNPFNIKKVFLKLESLVSNLRPSGCKKLQGKNDSWRLRAGDYRIIYSIDDKKLIVDVSRIRHRRDIYR